MRKQPDLDIEAPNFTLTVAQGSFGLQPLRGILQITESVQPAHALRRVKALRALIERCKAETVTKLLPAEFPVMPASLDSIDPLVDNDPALLRLTFRPAVHGETMDERLHMIQDVAPAIVDFVVGRFDPMA